jgi:PKD repeat protein
MARSNTSLVVATLLTVALSGCTLKKQDTPSLTGPSELGTSLALNASPDILTQDGASQSVVTIDARNSNGQPFRNLSLRAEIAAGGVFADFGTLSARNVVTDANGRATVVYTAPQAPSVAVDTGTVVEILVTPIGTDFGNSSSKTVDIRLVPPGMIVPPDGMVPKFTFTPGGATDHQSVFFDASTSTWNPTNPIEGFSWNFGDGETATGMTTTHSFDEPGTFLVTLTMTDVFGREASTTQTIVIGQGGSGMTADILFSPEPVVAGQATFFNASGSRPAVGHTIVRYAWNFGDGTTGSGVTISHTFATPSTYKVVLTVTDDAGHTVTATSQVDVGDGSPIAAFTFSPSALVSPADVTFDASSSKAVGSATITAYTWSFSGGTGPTTGQTVSHHFGSSGTFSVTLTVTDSAGKTKSTTQSVPVI